MWLLSAALAAPVVESAKDPVWVVHWEGDHVVALASSGEVRVYDPDLQELSAFDVGVRVNDITLSPDGRMLSTQAWRGRAELYDVSSGDRLAKVPKPDRWSMPVVVAGDGGRYLVASGGLIERHVDGGERVVAMDLWASGPSVMGYVGADPYFWENGRLHLYRPEGEEVLHTSAVGWAIEPAGEGFVLYDYGRAAEYVGLDGERHALGFGGTSSTFATSDTLVAMVDGTATRVELWDHQTGRSVGTVGEGAGAIQALAFSPDGSQLAVASMDGLLTILDVPDGPTTDLSAAPGQAPVMLAVSSDEARAFAAWPDGSATVWRLDSGAVERRLDLGIQAGWGQSLVAASPDLSWVLVADDRGTARRIEVATGEPVGPLLPASTSQSAVAVGIDGSFAVASDSWLRTWNAEGELVAELPMSPPGLMSVGDGGRTVATSDWSGVVSLWDAETASVRATRTSTSQWGGAATSLRVVEGGVVLVDPSGAHLWDLDGDDRDTAYESPVLGAVSADGGAVAMANWSGAVVSRQLDGTSLDEGAWGSPTLGSSLALLAVGSEGGLLMANGLGQVVWRKGEAQHVLTGALPEVLGLDEREGWVAVAHSHGVRVYDPASGAGRVLSDEGVTDLAFLPDGRLAGIDAQGREPPESAYTGEPYRYAWDVSTGERSVIQTRWQVDESRQLGWEMDVPGAKLKRRHKKVLSGPVADCPDGSRVLAAEYGWDTESTLLLVDPEGQVIEAELGATGQTIHRCAQQPGLTSVPGPIVAAVGTYSGMVWLVRVSDGEVLGGLPGDGSQVTDIVQLSTGGILVGYHSGAVRTFGMDGTFLEERHFYANGTTLAHDGERLR